MRLRIMEVKLDPGMWTETIEPGVEIIKVLNSRLRADGGWMVTLLVKWNEVEVVEIETTS